ncbi:transcription factor DIVARICATA-like [Andrographis paniculata]|uniref:transcription factor DIVARICATA-like n=1 Tax=Andrographis paniculata TaxID=175694 RepID=UPI0021E961FD|nr:transcription factor DIVARICATA-like [Andrographis paniculata]
METLCPTASLVRNSSWLLYSGHAWTKDENKRFENALAIFDEETPNRWIKVAAMIPGKSVDDVVNQYEELVSDIRDIEAGRVPMPGYFPSPFTSKTEVIHGHNVYKKRARMGDHDRKKGVPWTEEEHRRFLLGLRKHGKGDWRSISRNFVISKTPTQVASHAQKYYLRQLSGSKDKRRPSIHDITTIHTFPTDENNDDNNNNNDMPHLWDLCNKSTESSQSPVCTENEFLSGWNDANDVSLMAFDPSFIAYPAMNSRCILNVGVSTTGQDIVQMQTFLG